MTSTSRSATILVVEDDEDDRVLIRDAFAEVRPSAQLRFLSNGQELLDLLQDRGGFGAIRMPSRRVVILLDLNLPRKDGRKTLRELKTNSALVQIPVVVLTASTAPSDITASYRSGASSYLVKPSTFSELKKMMDSLAIYYLDMAKLPPFPGR
jgi:two-component system, response regulator